MSLGSYLSQLGGEIKLIVDMAAHKTIFKEIMEKSSTYIVQYINELSKQFLNKNPLLLLTCPGKMPPSAGQCVSEEQPDCSGRPLPGDNPLKCLHSPILLTQQTTKKYTPIIRIIKKYTASTF